MRGFYSTHPFINWLSLLEQWRSKIHLFRVYAEMLKSNLLPEMCSVIRNVEYEGDENTMQFIHIIISTRGTWGFVLSERECAFGNECVFMGRSGRVHRLRIHDVKLLLYRSKKCNIGNFICFHLIRMVRCMCRGIKCGCVDFCVCVCACCIVWIEAMYTYLCVGKRKCIWMAGYSICR